MRFEAKKQRKTADFLSLFGFGHKPFSLLKRLLYKKFFRRESEMERDEIEKNAGKWADRCQA